MKRLKLFFIKLGSFDRRIIFVIIGLSVLLPLIYPVQIPIRPTKDSQLVYETVDKLLPNSKVLVSFEYGPSTKPEIHPMAITLLRHLFRNNNKVYAFALWPDGNFMSTEALNQIARDELNLQYGEEWVNLGYKPGAEAVIKGISSDIRKMYPVDILGKSLESIPMMQGVNNIKDFDFVFSLSAGYPGSKEWVQYGCDPNGIPMSTGCTSIQVTEVLPYVENGQISGILAGMPGAAEYEALLNRPGKATGMMAAQSIAHIVIVLFIIFGNIAYFIQRKESERNKV